MVEVVVEKMVVMVLMAHLVVERLLEWMAHLVHLVHLVVMDRMVEQGAMVQMVQMVNLVRLVHLVCKEPHINKDLQYKLEQLVNQEVLAEKDLVGGLVVVVDKFRVEHHFRQLVLLSQGQQHSQKWHVSVVQLVMLVLKVYMVILVVAVKVVRVALAVAVVRVELEDLQVIQDKVE